MNIEDCQIEKLYSLPKNFDKVVVFYEALIGGILHSSNVNDGIELDKPFLILERISWKEFHRSEGLGPDIYVLKVLYKNRVGYFLRYWDDELEEIEE